MPSRRSLRRTFSGSPSAVGAMVPSALSTRCAPSQPPRVMRPFRLRAWARVPPLVARQPERDPVRHVEPGVLARALDRVDDLAREPLADQVLVERELQRNRVRALALELVAVERLHREQQVLRREAMLRAVEV